MKKLCLCLCILLVIMCIGITAFSSNVDNSGMWRFEVIGGTAVLTDYLGSSSDVYVPNKIMAGDSQYSVTKIGDGMFRNSTINSATIGEGITEIGDGAFENARNLVCIVTPESLTQIGENAFKDCSVFNSVIFPDALSDIGENAFLNCDALTVYCNSNTYGYNYVVSNSIPYVVMNPESDKYTEYKSDGITYYIMNGGAYAVAYDTSVADIVIPATVNGYPVVEVRSVFSGKTTLKTIVFECNVSTLPSSMFKGCYNLKSVLLPQNLSSITGYMFYECTALSVLDIPSTVTEIGSYAFYKCSYLPKAVIPEGVTDIPYNAFYGCSKLAEVVLPDSLKIIGSYAFYGCKALAQINFPQNLTEILSSSFYRCSALTNIELPDTLKSIDGYAFGECTGITQIKLPDKIETLGQYAFTACAKLNKVTIPGKIKNSHNNVFNLCVRLTDVCISEGSTAVRNYGFTNGVTNVSIPEGVTVIESGSFSNCTNLRKVKIPQSVTTLYTTSFGNNTVFIVSEGSYAHNFAQNNNIMFYVSKNGEEPDFLIIDGITYFVTDTEAVAIECDKTYTQITVLKEVNGVPVTDVKQIFQNNTTLQNVVIQSDITVIKDYMFSDCTSLKTVSFANDITFIGGYAFKNCSQLQSIDVGNKVTGVGNWTFYECAKLGNFDFSNITAIGERGFSGCVALTNINFSNKLRSIGSAAFIGCDGITEISIPDSVTNIGEQVFTYCDNIKKVTIPGNVENSYSSVFSQCTAVEEVVFTDSSTSIRNYGFGDSLKKITIPENVTEISASAFEKCTNLTDIVISENITSIGSKAFLGCAQIKSIRIPESVETIYKDSFSETTIWLVYENSTAHKFASENDVLYYVSDVDVEPEMFYENGITYFAVDGECTAIKCDETLTEAIIPKEISGLPVTQIKDIFSENTKLKKIVLKCHIEEISSKMFYNCTALEYVELPESINTINQRAFYGCTALKTMYLPQNVSYIGGYAFCNCISLTEIVLPSALEVINEYTFAQCGFTSIEIPEGVTTIGRLAFNKCANLTDISIPHTVTTIADEAFSNCSQLVEISLPEGLEVLGISVFSNCKKLKSLEFPQSVTKIGRKVASYCSKLDTVKLRGDIATSSSQAFESANGIKNVIFTEGSTRIKNFGFESSVTNIIIPDTVKSIDYSAFANCTNLTNVVIPEGVETIASSAFINSGKLRSVVIPESVKSILKNSFHESTVWIVYENSASHIFAQNSGSVLHCVIRKTINPEISYATTVSGVVKYTDGSVASGVTVDIMYDDGQIKQSKTTNENGEYLFDYAEVGRYTIRARDDYNKSDSEIISVMRMNVFDVYLAGKTNLVLKNSFLVSGTVSDSNARITLSDTKGNIVKSIDVTNGEFSFENIPYGSYILKAESENGIATDEIHVTDEDITGKHLEIQPTSSTISGDTKIENRDGTFSEKICVTVNLIDENGNIIARTATDKEGKYTFAKIPAGNYKIVAITNEIRPDYAGGFDKNYELKGYGYIDIAQAGEYITDTIILREDKINLTTISGQITTDAASGKVTLSDEDGDQIAIFYTSSNGKFKFENIPDGVYAITAVTDDGMGFEIISVADGVVHGDTKIKVIKSDMVSKLETILETVPDEIDAESAYHYKGIIEEVKKAYDKLSDKQKNQASEKFTDKLTRYINFFSNHSFDKTEGIDVKNIESVISYDELEEEIEFKLTVTETTPPEPGEDGINTAQEYETEKIRDEKATDGEIIKYYDIKFYKDGENISNIQKQTDTNGKLIITMEIPEEYRGHKHYSFIHMHNGEAVTLVDLDDNPDTITIEIDKFSTIALAYSDVSLTGTPYPGTMTYDTTSGKLSVLTSEKGTLYVADYSDGKSFSGVQMYAVEENTEMKVDFGQNNKAFLWNSNCVPLCEAFDLMQ